VSKQYIINASSAHARGGGADKSESRAKGGAAWLHARCFYCGECINNNRYALSFSWLWPRGKQSQPRYAAYMVITSPQQVGALDASEQRRTEAYIECARAPRRSRHTDPLFAKMHSHFAWFS